MHNPLCVYAKCTTGYVKAGVCHLMTYLPKMGNSAIRKVVHP